MGAIDEGRKRHLASQTIYARKIRKSFEKVTDQFLKVTTGIEKTRFASSFRLKDAPVFNKEITKLFEAFGNEMYDITVAGITDSWGTANAATDKLVNQYLVHLAKVKQVPLKYMNHNPQALKAFINRKLDAGKLSDLVWNNAEHFRKELELHLGLGIVNGDSAETISRRVRRYLSDPDALFRRIRNEAGNLKLSKRAKEYEAGRGRYRSSYKNAMRLTRTETNMAYRSADFERWQDIDFITGIEIELSAQHPVYDICDELKGMYPRDFKFTGWHPQCFCFVTPILMEQDEFMKYLNDEPFKQPQMITDVPRNFKDYMAKYGEQIRGWKNKPYWLLDNEKLLKNGSSVKPIGR